MHTCVLWLIKQHKQQRHQWDNTAQTACRNRPRRAGALTMFTLCLGSCRGCCQHRLAVLLRPSTGVQPHAHCPRCLRLCTRQLAPHEAPCCPAQNNGRHHGRLCLCVVSRKHDRSQATPCNTAAHVEHMPVRSIKPSLHWYATQTHLQGCCASQTTCYQCTNTMLPDAGSHVTSPQVHPLFSPTDHTPQPRRAAAHSTRGAWCSGALPVWQGPASAANAPPPPMVERVLRV